MTKSNFIAKIVKRGNATTITIPKGIADVYGIGSEIKVTLDDVKKQYMNLNVGVCTSKNVAIPYVFDCFTIDVLKSPSVDFVCDVNNLPFRDGAFKDVFCFHVLEHVETPAKALKELVRVASRMVELEVPHRWGMHSKTGPSHLLPQIPRKKSNEFKGVQYGHVSSFRTMWFHKCLKNFKHCLKVYFEFPWDLLIHVWIYKDGWEKIE